MCSEECDVLRSDKLKAAILDYFDRQPNLKNGQITMISFARETEAKPMIDQEVGGKKFYAQIFGGEGGWSCNVSRSFLFETCECKRKCKGSKHHKMLW